jgi:hypothetical protein
MLTPTLCCAPTVLWIHGSKTSSGIRFHKIVFVNKKYGNNPSLAEKIVPAVFDQKGEQ